MNVWKNKKNRGFCEKIRQNIWWHQKKYVPLHSQSENKDYFNKGLRLRNGSVAQLNRASDYGSEGYGFESRRSHKRFHENYKELKIKEEDVIHLTSFFLYITDSAQ